MQSLSEVDRCVLDGDTEGFVKVYVRRHSDKILGGTAVGKRAGELIGMLSMAMTNGIGLKSMANTIFPYPTEGEIFRRLGDQYNRTRLTPHIKWLLSHWISWRR
jgi:pyruvate/2-oxoglutarate dehydrogenase complex dihydrolipoamide dehydrogenase (E3) component